MINIDVIVDELFAKVDAKLIFSIKTLMSDVFNNISKVDMSDSIVDHLIGNDIRC